MADDDIDNVDDIDDIDDEDFFGEAGRAKGLTDSLRKAAVAGMTALFVTEGGIRGALGELRLPKEALAHLAQQTDKTRRELFGAVSEELKGFLAGIDLPGELRKALKGLKLEVKAEVRFVEDRTTATAEVKAQPLDGHDAGAGGRRKTGEPDS